VASCRWTARIVGAVVAGTGYESVTTQRLTMAKMAASVTTAIIETVYPRRCAGCARRGSWLCDECDAMLPRWTPPWCDRCGVPSALGTCQCDQLPPELDRVRSIAAFDGWLQEAIVAFKYSGEWARCDHLAARLHDAAADIWSVDVDGIVPVPLHPRRERARGFNQAEMLATRIGPSLGTPVFSILRRTRNTPQQVGLDADTRKINVEGAFVSIRDVNGLRLVLVDDVLTTGSTLGACANELRARGAASVSAVTLARQHSSLSP